MLKRIALVALVALSLGLVACSGEEKQDTTTPEGTTATESVDTATDSTMATGDVPAEAPAATEDAPAAGH